MLLKRDILLSDIFTFYALLFISSCDCILLQSADSSNKSALEFHQNYNVYVFHYKQ